MSVFLFFRSGGKLVFHLACGGVCALPGVTFELEVVHADVSGASSARSAASSAGPAASAATVAGTSASSASPGVSSDCVHAFRGVIAYFAHLSCRSCRMQVVRQLQVGCHVLEIEGRRH